MRTACSLLLVIALPGSGLLRSQDAVQEAKPKYRLTVIETASSAKRIKKNRVSAEAVVKVTDENDVPVGGIVVTFTIPHLVGGGASFATGTTASIVTTNAAGLATSGSFVAGTSSTFSIGVAASVPGGTLTAAVPVNTAAALAASGSGAAGGAAGGAGAGTGTGVSTGVIVGVVAGVAAVGAVVAKVASGGGSSPKPAQPSIVTGTVGLGSGPVLGGPR